jgi:(2Fe-2S) ferredoxin
MGRMWRRNITPEQVKKIAEALNAAARVIEDGKE